jgi:hypothetical protein
MLRRSLNKKTPRHNQNSILLASSVVDGGGCVCRMFFYREAAAELAWFASANSL